MGVRGSVATELEREVSRLCEVSFCKLSIRERSRKIINSVI